MKQFILIDSHCPHFQESETNSAVLSPVQFSFRVKNAAPSSPALLVTLTPLLSDRAMSCALGVAVTSSLLPSHQWSSDE